MYIAKTVPLSQQDPVYSAEDILVWEVRNLPSSGSVPSCLSSSSSSSTLSSSSSSSTSKRDWVAAGEYLVGSYVLGTKEVGYPGSTWILKAAKRLAGFSETEIAVKQAAFAKDEKDKNVMNKGKQLKCSTGEETAIVRAMAYLFKHSI